MFAGMATELLRIPLPEGFDPGKHLKALERMIADRHGDGWEVDHIDPEAGEAVATKHVAITEIAASSVDPDERVMKLAKGTKPSDGDKVAARLADQNPGWEMTRFDPYLATATLAKMDADTSRCRRAVAVALGVKPWHVEVERTADGGFELTMPDTYVASKHDEKLDEVAATVVGRLGWTFRGDPATRTGRIVPGDPPSFPSTIHFDFSQTPDRDRAVETGEWARVPLGMLLPASGSDPDKVLTTVFDVASHMQISGISGGGKSVVLTNLIAGALARGWELAIVDAIKTGVDFADFENYVRDAGWGCESLAEAVTVLKMAYEEGVRRKKLVKEHRVQKWSQIPAAEGVRPLLVVVDEVSSLLANEPVPKIAKDDPLVLEVQERNLLRSTALNIMGKIARELRFVGVSLVISSQVSSTATGVPTEMRTNLGQKILLGANPTDNNRRLALASPDMVPEVPPHVAADADGAARGVGVFEFETINPGVFKGFFAPPPDFSAWLDKIGVAVSSRPRPTAAEVARHTPSLEAAGERPAPRRSDDGGMAARSGPSIDAGFATGDICSTCGGPVDPLTAECRCTR